MSADLIIASLTVVCKLGKVPIRLWTLSFSSVLFGSLNKATVCVYSFGVSYMWTLYIATGLGLGLGFDFTFEVRPSETSKNGLGLGLDFILGVYVVG